MTDTSNKPAASDPGQRTIHDTQQPQVAATYKSQNGAIVRITAITGDVVHVKHVSGPESANKQNDWTMPLRDFQKDFTLYEKAA